MKKFDPSHMNWDKDDTKGRPHSKKILKGGESEMKLYALTAMYLT